MHKNGDCTNEHGRLMGVINAFLEVAQHMIRISSLFIFPFGITLFLFKTLLLESITSLGLEQP